MDAMVNRAIASNFTFAPKNTKASNQKTPETLIGNAKA
jgi:hypothetical protein